METTPNSAANKEFQVTGVSRSGRVRKKSSKLLDFQSPDEVEKKLKRAPKPVPRNGTTRPRLTQAGIRPTARRPAVGGGVGIGGGLVDDLAADDDELNDDMDANATTDGEHFDDDAADDALPTGDSDEDLKELVAGIVDGVEPLDSAGNPESKVRSSLYMTEKANKRKMLKDGRVITGKVERKDKGKTRYTGYSMWARELRKSGRMGRNLELDFTTTAKRLGELWANVSNKEKTAWRRKAKIQATKAKSRERAVAAGNNNNNNATSTPYMSYFKPTTSRTKKLAAERQKSPSISPIATKARPNRSTMAYLATPNTAPDAELVPKRKRNNSHNRLNTSGGGNAVATGGATPTAGEHVAHGNLATNNNLLANTHHTTSAHANAHVAHRKSSLPSTEPIDAAAHLKLLGESLTIIGERLKEHEGQIAVSGSLSVLLDSLLCSLGPLLCLTTRIPGLERKPQLSENLAATLDNIAYVMPGL